MPKSGLTRAAVYAGSLLAVVALALFTARLAAGVLHENRTGDLLRERQQARREFTEELLRSTNTLSKCSSLHEYSFEDLDGNPVALSTLPREPLLLVFIDPLCEGCDAELKEINEVVPQGEANDRIIVISSGDRESLQEKLSGISPRCRILVDPGSDYVFQLGIYTFPFNVLIDDDRVIRDIMAANLDRLDLRQFIEKKRLE